MGSSRAVKDALLDQEDRKTVGVTVQDGAAHATAGAGAGDEKAVDSLAQQIGDQVRPEEGAGPALRTMNSPSMGLIISGNSVARLL